MILISLEDAKAEVRKVVSDFRTRYDINYRLNNLPSIELNEIAEQTEPMPTMFYPQVDGITPSVIQTEPKPCEECKHYLFTDVDGYYCEHEPNACEYEPKTEPSTDCS